MWLKIVCLVKQDNDASAENAIQTVILEEIFEFID
jgi:hypothetical protein